MKVTNVDTHPLVNFGQLNDGDLAVIFSSTGEQKFIGNRCGKFNNQLVNFDASADDSVPSIRDSFLFTRVSVGQGFSLVQE